jgi:hypothetical protein
MRDAFVGKADWRDKCLYDLDALWLFRAVWLNSSSSPLDKDLRCANGVIANPHGRPLSSRVCLFAGNFVVIGWRIVIVSRLFYGYRPKYCCRVSSCVIEILPAGKLSKTGEKE